MSARCWILVVDDDDSIRELMAMIIESRGFEVRTAADGVEALEQLATPVPPALIFLDLTMPGMDGLTFLKELRRRPACAQIPVVVLSGDARATRTLNGEEVQGCMTKPIDLEDLLGAVERHV